MSYIAGGDIVRVVLDVVHVSGPDGEFERVLLQGVFPQGAELPPAVDGASRNVVSAFFNTDMRSVSAFLIETALQREPKP